MPFSITHDCFYIRNHYSPFSTYILSLFYAAQYKSFHSLEILALVPLVFDNQDEFANPENPPPMYLQSVYAIHQ